MSTSATYGGISQRSRKAKLPLMKNNPSSLQLAYSPGDLVKLKMKALNSILLQSTHNVFLSFFHVPADLLIPSHHQ